MPDLVWDYKNHVYRANRTVEHCLPADIPPKRRLDLNVLTKLDSKSIALYRRCYSNCFRWERQLWMKKRSTPLSLLCHGSWLNLPISDRCRFMIISIASSDLNRRFSSDPSMDSNCDCGISNSIPVIFCALAGWRANTLGYSRSPSCCNCTGNWSLGLLADDELPEVSNSMMER